MGSGELFLLGNRELTVSLPAFLQGFTTLVFNQSTGRILHEPSIKAVQSVRQVCFFYKKVNLACSEDRIAKAFRQFEQTENDLHDLVISKENITLFETVSRVIVSSCFPRIVDEYEFIPHHGPGSTMEQLTGNRKFDYRRFKWYDQLNSAFTPGLTIYPSEEWEHADTSSNNCSSDRPFVRVVHVPKTLKSPRIIAMEPVAMQMAQQSVKDFMVQKLESGPITGGHINFRDQQVNQDLALSSSFNRDLATLDLSEASDRVRKDLVSRMLKVNPSLRKFIFSSRSPYAKVGHKLIHLEKFASMGSALCFPVESLLFFIIIVTALCKSTDQSSLSAKRILRLSRKVFVYGDDLVVPTKKVDAIITALHAFGCKVNTRKSYYKSDFRESCGMDAFKGVMVTPVYMRSPFMYGKCKARTILSLVSTANQLFKAGSIRAATFIKNEVEGTLGFKLPRVTEESSGLGWVCRTGFRKLRYNNNLQRLEVLTLVPAISMKVDKIAGAPALLKCLLKLEIGERSPEDHKIPQHWDRSEQLYRIAISDKKHLGLPTSMKNAVKRDI